MTKDTITLILAPLQGFTDLTFRTVYADHFSGIDLAVAPFISTMGEQRLKPSRIKDVDPEKNKNLFVIPQILSNVAKDFIFLADHLNAMGHNQVNWNLGCPHSKIAKKQRGSGLLLYPEKIDALLSEIIPEMAPSLSVKIRLGRRNKDEIHELLAVFNRHSIDEIILHPRTGEQMYTGRSDLDAFERASQSTQHPLTYNGDIVDLASYTHVQKKFPNINRIMIGRGILSNPFLGEEIKNIHPTPQDPSQRLARLRAFHDDLFAAYGKIFSGPAHLTGRMKGVWSYLGPSFENSKKPLKKIVKARSVPAYEERVNAFFDLNLRFNPGRHKAGTN
ncbi:MAG: tRNA-dihydrouridine synthase family protein [Desulfobacter sp.]|nr:tRNA-dihydrouridine synthase family protein [Desulfobacter sp.]WDP87302.1 MAG: tRNA-dihydrouridine synthase family protein [Desulfobacter sp.]